VKQLPTETTLLQIPILLIHAFKKGNITLQTNGVENIQLQIENNKIDLNFLQKEHLKTLFELEAEMKEESILEKIKNLRKLAEKLKQERSTLAISYKGQTILTLGFEAKPTITQIVTGTNAIQVNNLIELVKLVK